jgi:hypothetical protein
VLGPSPTNVLNWGVVTYAFVVSLLGGNNSYMKDRDSKRGIVESIIQLETVCQTVCLGQREMFLL